MDVKKVRAGEITAGQDCPSVKVIMNSFESV
jgi:hypothetical protein